MGSSLVSRLKALSPQQLALVALGSLALAGAGTAAVNGLIDGTDLGDRALTGGDEDAAGGKVSYVDKRPSVQTQAQALKNAQISSPAAAGGPTAVGGGRIERTDPTPRTTVPAAAPAAGGSGGGGGPKGNSGAAGPKGDTGPAGPTPAPRTDTDATGPTGPTGDTGPSGPTPAPTSTGGTTSPKTPTAPAPAAPAVLVVKDAAGATAGVLASADPNADWLAFSYKGRMFAANARTGALELPKVDTSYVTDDCSGTPYSTLSRPAKSVLRSSNPGETGIYEFGQPRSVDVRSIWQVGENGAADMCLQYVYTNTELAPLNELAASERPPTLTGPLKAVRE